MDKKKPLGETIEPRYAVALPCDPSDFSNFISSLLGKPQTISKAYSGSFEITHKDIENAYHLVAQRVGQQNRASLIQFTVRLVFDDNSTVLLNNLADFQTYAEVRPVVVTQAHLSWSFLVQFEDRSHPEKQEIELSFTTKGSGGIAIFDTEDSPIIPISRFLGGGHASFRIKHTARTWGADIESLLSGHIKHILLPEGKVRSFIRRHSGKIAALFGLTFFVSSLAACFYSAGKAERGRLEILKPILSDGVNLDLKLNTLLDMVARGYWGTFFFSVFVFTVFSLVVAILLGVWAETSADTYRPSYILLTKKSEQYKQKADSEYQSKFLSFLASIFTAIVTGVVSNIIFTLYWASSP
jgi:hypothetical protein